MCIIFHIVLSHIQWLLQSQTKLLEKVFPIMSTFLRNKNISKTTPLRKENPFPQFNVASYKRPGIRLPFEYTTTLLSGEGAEERTGTATMFRKMLPKYAIFSTVLSTIVVTILNYLLHIFWLLFSFYSIGLLVILETNLTCISFKYIKRTPCIRPKFHPRFCVNLLCPLFTLLPAIGWQTVNLQMNQTVRYQGTFSRITGFSGKRFVPPPPPSSLILQSSISFAFPPTQ